MAAVPQTEMAKALVGGPATVDRSFAKYLQNGAMMNFLAAVEPASWNKINDMSFNLMAQMAGMQASDPEIQTCRRSPPTHQRSGRNVGRIDVHQHQEQAAVRGAVCRGVKDTQAISSNAGQMPARCSTAA